LRMSFFLGASAERRLARDRMHEVLRYNLSADAAIREKF